MLSSSSEIDAVQTESVINDSAYIYEIEPENILSDPNNSTTTFQHNEDFAACQEGGKLSTEILKVQKMPLPPLVLFHEALNNRKLFIFFLDKIVEHVAYWIIQNGDIVSSQGHSLYRERMAEEYPLLKEKCIEVL